MAPLSWELVRIPLGATIVVFNSIIFLAIIKNKLLRKRKEYLVVGGLALADTLFGLSHVCTTAYRTWLKAEGLEEVVMSAWDCMLQPPSFLRLYSSQLCSVMLTCTSFDRLLSVLVPIWYLKQTIKYAKRLVGSFYLGTLLSCLALAYVSYTKHNTHFYTSICRGSETVGRGAAAQYNYVVRTMGAIVSVGLYAIIPFVYKCMAPNVPDLQQRQKEKQKRLTHTLGISACVTAAFVVAPNLFKTGVAVLFPHSINSGLKGSLVTAATNLSMVNPIVNFFLYTMRHPEIKNAIGKMFKKSEVSHAKVVPFK